MHTGRFPITEHFFDFGDTEAIIEITDDNMVRLTRIDADPTLPHTLEIDAPANEVRVSGSMGILVIKAQGKRFQSNHAPEIMPMINRGHLRKAGRRVQQSGNKEWVQAFKAAGSRTWFLSYPMVFWGSIVFSILLFTGIAVGFFVTWEGPRS